MLDKTLDIIHKDGRICNAYSEDTDFDRIIKLYAPKVAAMREVKLAILRLWKNGQCIREYDFLKK